MVVGGCALTAELGGLLEVDGTNTVVFVSHLVGSLFGSWEQVGDAEQNDVDEVGRGDAFVPDFDSKRLVRLDYLRVRSTAPSLRLDIGIGECSHHVSPIVR